MKKTIVTLIAFILCTGFINAQKDKIVGNWLVKEVKTENRTQTPYMITEYTEDSKMIMMGMELATWDYNKKSNEIVMTSEFDKDFNGNSKILKLTNKKLVVEKDDAIITYLKLDLEKIAEANKNSGLMGDWEISSPNPETKYFVTFKELDQFIFIQKDDYHESTIKGTWIFNKDTMSLTMIGFRDKTMPFGESKITRLDAASLELKNNGNTFKAIKKTQPTQKIERLTFTQEDFFTEEGDYLYENEEQKLPWYQLSVYGMRNTYAAINQVTYNYKTLIDETQSFDSKTLTTNVSVNFEEDEIEILFDYIFNGYDSYNLPEDYNLPPNKHDNYNDLFPYEDISFRVVSNEKISVPAGDFDCTVLEGLGSSEEMVKLWMIDDMPGIYAKIIQDNPDEHFGSYHIYELQEIKKTH